MPGGTASASPYTRATPKRPRAVHAFQYSVSHEPADGRNTTRIQAPNTNAATMTLARRSPCVRSAIAAAIPDAAGTSQAAARTGTSASSSGIDASSSSADVRKPSASASRASSRRRSPSTTNGGTKSAGSRRPQGNAPDRTSIARTRTGEPTGRSSSRAPRVPLGGMREATPPEVRRAASSGPPSLPIARPPSPVA